MVLPRVRRAQRMRIGTDAGQHRDGSTRHVPHAEREHDDGERGLSQNRSDDEALQ